MENKIIQKIDLFLIPICLIYPMLGISLVFCYSIYKRKIDYRFILALGLLAYLYIPTTFDDLGRIYKMYERSKITEINQIFQGKDYFLNSFYYFKKYSFAKKEILPFLAVIIYVSSIFRLFNKNIKERNISKYLFLFLLVFFNINPRSLITTVRTPLAFGMILIGIDNLIYKKKVIKGYFYNIISNCIHFSSIGYNFLYLICINKRLRKFLGMFFKLSFLFYFLTPNTFYELISIFPIPEKYEGLVKVYTLGKFGVNYEKGANTAIYSALYTYIGYFNLAYLIFFKGDSKLRETVKVFWIFGNIFSTIPNLYSRYTIIPRILTTLIMAEEFSEAKKNRIFYIILYFFMSMFFFALTLYTMRESIEQSWILNIIITPSDILKYSVDIKNLIIK